MLSPPLVSPHSVPLSCPIQPHLYPISLTVISSHAVGENTTSLEDTTFTWYQLVCALFRCLSSRFASRVLRLVSLSLVVLCCPLCRVVVSSLVSCHVVAGSVMMLATTSLNGVKECGRAGQGGGPEACRWHRQRRRLITLKNGERCTIPLITPSDYESRNMRHQMTRLKDGGWFWLFCGLPIPSVIYTVPVLISDCQIECRFYGPLIHLCMTFRTFSQ